MKVQGGARMRHTEHPRIDTRSRCRVVLLVLALMMLLSTAAVAIHRAHAAREVDA